jgi:hypothetical protein
LPRQAAYIVQRFVAMWQAASQAGFTAFRGMVVTRSRQHVVWFVQVGPRGGEIGRRMVAGVCAGDL